MSLLVFEPISASGLPNVALVLPMDPYIQLCLGGQAVKGTPVQGGGRSPQWERRPRNRVLVPVVGAPTRLLVEVRNRQYMMQDQLLGATTLEIGAILEGAEHAAPISLPLQDSSGAAAGEQALMRTSSCLWSMSTSPGGGGLFGREAGRHLQAQEEQQQWRGQQRRAGGAVDADDGLRCRVAHFDLDARSDGERDRTAE